MRDLFEQASKRAKESKQPKSEKKWFARFSKGSDDEILDDGNIYSFASVFYHQLTNVCFCYVAPNITIIFIDEIDALGSRGDLHVRSVIWLFHFIYFNALPSRIQAAPR